MNRKREGNDTKSSNLTSQKSIVEIYDEVKITPELIQKLEKKEYSAPVSIFSEKLSCLETIVKYLRESLELSNKEAAKILNRSEKTIYQAYSSARKKYVEKFAVELSEYYIPVSILSERKFAVLESIVKYLFENYQLNYSQISRLLHRDPRTIWTVYSRARRKNVK